VGDTFERISGELPKHLEFGLQLGSKHMKALYCSVTCLCKFCSSGADSFLSAFAVFFALPAFPEAAISSWGGIGAVHFIASVPRSIDATTSERPSCFDVC